MTIPQDEQNTRLRPLRPLRAVKMAIRLGWDHIGLWMIVGFTLFSLLSVPLMVWQFGHLFPPLLLVFICALIVALGFGPLLAGAHTIAWDIGDHRETGWLDLWRGARELMIPAALLGLIHMVVLIVGTVALWFYLRQHSFISVIATLVCIYCLGTWVVLAPLQMPLLVMQERGVFDEPERRARRGAVAVIRRSFFVALGAPAATCALLIANVGILTFSVLTVITLPLFTVGMLAMLNDQVVRALLVRFCVLPPPPDPQKAVEDEKFRVKFRADGVK